MLIVLLVDVTILFVVAMMRDKFKFFAFSSDKNE